MIPYEPGKHAPEKTRAVNYWHQELQQQGHSLGEWESTRPGYGFSAGCRCVKCGLTFLGTLLDGVLVPLPASKMQLSECEYAAWISEAQVIVALEITRKHWRKWIKNGGIKTGYHLAQVRIEQFTYNDNGGTSVTCYYEDDVKRLIHWVHRRVDKNGKLYLSLRNPALPTEPPKEENPECEPPSSEESPVKRRKSRSGTKKPVPA